MAENPAVHRPSQQPDGQGKKSPPGSQPRQDNATTQSGMRSTRDRSEAISAGPTSLPSPRRRQSRTTGPTCQYRIQKHTG